MRTRAQDDHRTGELIGEFCAAVRARSAEHADAIGLLQGGAAAPGVVIAILRQELDSMVRAIFLLSCGGRERGRMLASFAKGERWTRRTEAGKQRPVTDADMVALASKLHGWTRNVYTFGCAYIHLTRLHAHRTTDPLSLLPHEERRAVRDYLHRYHGTPNDDSMTFADLVPVLPLVFQKVRDNLEVYLQDLEAGRALPR